MNNLSNMSLELSEAQKLILEQVDRACNELRPIEEKFYLKSEYNDKIVPIFKKAQLLGLPVSEKCGGQGADALTYALMLQRIGQEGCSVRTFFSGHISIGQMTIDEWGTDEQKEKYLPSATKGEKIMAFALTEPSAGSDPGSLKTTFEEKGDHYILNGTKAWISNATVADVITAYAKDKEGKISAFIVEKDFEGYSTQVEKNKMGLRSSDTGSIIFENCKVPKENLLGPYGHGLSVALATIMNGRLSVAAGCVGVIEDCLKEAVAYAKERVQHGKEIGKHQLIQRHIAKMSTNFEAAKLLVYKAALEKIKYNQDKNNKEQRAKADSAIARAKFFASNASFDAANRAVQIFGANGYSFENRPARHLCDCRVTMIYEGANEILLQKIALEHLGKEFSAFK